MDHLIEQCSGIAGANPPARKFRIAIVYENLVSAARALRACEFLRGEVPGDPSFDVNVWNMGLLGMADNRAQAASAASSADVVIVSASARDGVPPAFRAWVDAWLWLNRGRQCALFALFGDHIGPSALSMATYLRHKSLARGIDFFCHPPLDAAALGSAADSQLALADSPRIRVSETEEWRPGSAQQTEFETRQTAFELVENFAENLRVRLRSLKASAA